MAEETLHSHIFTADDSHGFTEEVLKANRAKNDLDTPSLQAICSTVSLLVNASASSRASPSATTWPPFIPSSLVLLPPNMRSDPGASASAGSPTPETSDFLRSLVLAFNQSAIQHACSSILAGNKSESDVYGDVAFWLGSGDFNRGSEDVILERIGLGQLLDDQVAELHKEALTVALNDPPISELLSKLQNTHSFRINFVTSSDVLHFVVGRIGNDEWVGLIGAGTWT